MKIKVGVSNRHVHLTEEVYNILFNEPLEKERDLDQPGQFAAKQKVSIKNENYTFDNVRIVGPLRKYNQVEVSRTDSYKLKVKPPVRASSDLEGSLPITIIGPCGEVNLENGLILANRHIHMAKEDLERLNILENEELAVKIEGEKSGVLRNVYPKVSEKASFILHLDTDDANAFGLKTEDSVELLRIKER